MEIPGCALCANVLAHEKLTPQDLEIIRPALKSVTLDTTFISGFEDASSVFCEECEALLLETKRLKVLLKTVTSQLISTLAKVKLKFEGRAVWFKVEDVSDVESVSSEIGFSIVPVEEDDERSVGVADTQERSEGVEGKNKRSLRVNNVAKRSVRGRIKQKDKSDSDSESSSNKDDGFSNYPDLSVKVTEKNERSLRVNDRVKRSTRIKQKVQSDDDSQSSSNKDDGFSNDPDFEAISSSDDDANVKSSSRKRRHKDSDSEFELNNEVKKRPVRKAPIRRSQRKVGVKNKPRKKPVDKTEPECENEIDDDEDSNPAPISNNRTRIAKCRFCGLYVKSDVFSICIHERKEHPEKFTHLCATCGSTFAQENEVLTCQETHKESSAGQFKCFVCNDQCDDGASLRDHLESKHTEGGAKCNECDKRFKDVRKVQRHKAAEHGDELPLKCPICGKGAIHQSVLEDHIRGAHKKHPDKSLIPPPIPCNKCDRIFNSRVGLYYHRKKVHGGGGLFACEECGKKLRCAETFEAHKNAHLGLKSYVCDVCDRTCATFAALRIHKRIHTGEMPYKCHICDTAFRQLTALNRHLEIHKKNGTWKEKGSSEEK